MKPSESVSGSVERQLFFRALEQPAGKERAAFLQGACADDPDLRRRLEALLQKFESLGTFLEEPAVSAPDSLHRLSAGGNSPTETVSANPLTEKTGDRIDRYKLLQQIGEGGCGVVYMAEQEQPVRRRVALKVIKLGMDTKNVIARFEAERQALALMDHPNIAKVLDAGATATGRPYFVMELVRGIKITEYCDQNNLPTRHRLELFIQICRAIQHAHQKGVIHRDIKPSNILVTLHDGIPVPKVIDFGIAKATTQQRLTEKTLFTQFEQFLGTPAYMSPEQAEMGGLDIDTRTDIYSLGVLLYELLTGETPFDSEELLASGLDAMRRTIREKQPVRPSTRLSTMLAGELTTAAKQRASEAPKLIHALRGDLDWIVMKALEKDRTRRYDTVNGLAMDLQRHVNNEPVIARPPSNRYRFQKLVRRNKLVFAAGGAVAAALAIGLGVSMWLLIEERAARRNAVAAQNQALTEMRKSQQSVDFLRELLHRLSPAVAKDRDTTRLKEALDGLAWQVQPDLLNKPELEQNLLSTIALLYLDFGEGQKAEEMARRGVASLRNGVSQGRTLSAEPLRVLRDVLMQEHKYAETRELFEGSLPEELGLKPQGAEMLRIRGDFWARTGNWTEAVADFSKLIKLEPDNHEGYFSLAPLLVQTGDVAAYRQICDQIRTRFGGITNDSSLAHRMGRVCLLVPAPGPELATGTSLADLSVTLGRGRINEPWCLFAKGLADYRRGRYASALDWMQKVQKIMAGQTRWRPLNAESYIVLAMAKQQLKQANEAREGLAGAIAIVQKEMPKLEGADLTDGWRDWLIAHILMSEAKALIQPPRVTPGAQPVFPRTSAE